MFHSDFRFRYQLHVDDVVILAESVCDLQHGLTPAICWSQQRRCSWGMGLEKSVAIVFGPVRPRPSSSVLLSGELLHVVSSCRCSGVVMTSSLRWDAHFTHLISRGHWFFAQRTSRDHSEGFSATPTHFLLTTCVVPSTISSTEFIGDCNGKSRADGLRTTTMGCRLSRWASRTPSVSAVDEFALVDSFRVSSGQASALFGRLHSFFSGIRVPISATVFTFSVKTPGTWVHWCLSLLQYMWTLVSLVLVRVVLCRWLQRVGVSLRRLWRGFASFFHVRFTPGVVRRPFHIQCQHRFRHGSMVGLARHGYDPAKSATSLIVCRVAPSLPIYVSSD